MAASLDQIPSGLPRDANAVPLQHTYANIQSGSVTVTTSGTPVQLANTYTEAKLVTIQNPAGSGATIYVGGTLVSSTKGIPVLQNNTYSIPVTDLSKVWVDSNTNGTAVPFNYQW